MNVLLRPLTELSDDAADEAGGKMARLGTLRRAGVPVPRGFVVTAGAFRQVLAAPGVRSVVAGALAGLDRDDAPALARAAAAVRQALLAADLPDPLERGLARAYTELAAECGRAKLPLAVRSSATAEDGASASFAGQFDTVLGVTGIEGLRGALRRCWASAFNERALAYRLRAGLAPDDSPMAVGVTELIEPRASGVAFSLHPVTGKRDRLVIEGSFGFGEAVVQGAVTPDHVEVGRSDRRVLRYDVGDKRVLSALHGAGVVEVPMPDERRGERVLSDADIAGIVETTLRIEALLGHAVDVEWVLRGAHADLVVVQARAVTGPQEAEVPADDLVHAALRYAFKGLGA